MSSGRGSLRRILVILAGVEVFWLVVVNLFLNTGLAPWAINQKPEKWSVTWERAWTLYPARVHMSGFGFEQHMKNMDMQISADSISASVHLLSLIGKQFKASRVDAEALAFDFQRRTKGEKAAAEPSADAARSETAGETIEAASSNEAAQGTEAAEGEVQPPQPRKPPGFKIAIHDFDVDGIEGITFDDFQVSGGDSKVQGSFLMQIRGNMEIRDVNLRWPAAVVTMGETVMAESLGLSFQGGIQPFDPKVDKGVAMLRRLTGDLSVDGQVGSLAPFKVFFANSKWVQRLDGSGDVAVRLVVDDGRLQPDTLIDVEANDLLADFMGYRAQGKGRIDGEVNAAAAGNLGEVRVSFDDFAFGRPGDDQPLARGSNLRLETGVTRLGGGTEELADFYVLLDIPDSEVPDISVLDQLMPPGMDAEIRGGSATLKAHLEARGEERQADGSFELRGEDLSGSWADFDFEIDLEAVTRISGNRLDDLEIQLNGTSVKLLNGVFDQKSVDVEEGWWLTVEVPQGKAVLDDPPEAEVEMNMSMRDTRALVAMFAEMKSWVKFIKGILTVKDVEGHAMGRLSDQRLSLRELKLAGDKLNAEGELELSKDKEDSAGILWVKFGPVGVAMERIGAEREFQMYHARKWFEERYAARWQDGRTPSPEEFPQKGDKAKEPVPEDPPADAPAAEETEDEQSAQGR